MGDIAAEKSVDRVIMAHGSELIDETLTQIRPFLAALGVAPGRVIGLAVNAVTELEIHLIAVDQYGTPIERCRRVAARYDIAELADRYPDCEVGW
jgi:hypothetical protein